MTSLYTRRTALSLLAATPAALLAACSGGAADPGTLVVLVNGPSGEVRFMQLGSGRITQRLTVGGEPHHIVRDAGRGRVYVTDRAGDSVLAIDVLTHQVVKQVRVGREPHFAALAADGRRLYVTVTGDGALAIVDTNSLEVTGTVPTGVRPMGVAVSSDGSRVFVANDADETLVIVDPAAQRPVFRPLRIPGGVHGGLALSNDGTTLLSGTMGRPAIATIDVGSRRVREVALGPAAADAHAAHNVLATPDGRFWLAALAGSSNMVALPAGGGDPVAIPTDDHPSGFAVAPGRRILVASRDGEDLVEVDLAKGKATRRIRVGAGHNDLVVFSRSTLEALRSG